MNDDFDKFVESHGLEGIPSKNWLKVKYKEYPAMVADSQCVLNSR